MAPVTLLHFVNEFTDGSVNKLILSLIKQLDPDHYEFHVLGLKAAGGPMEAAFRDAGASTLNMGMHGKVGLELVRQLARYISEHNIQILHTHVLRPDILGGIAARLAQRPMVISTKHNPSYTRRQQAWLLRNLIYWPAMYLPDHIITVTELIRQQAMVNLRIKPERISTIHNGIETERFYKPEARQPMRTRLGIGSDETVLMFTGRLIGGKGLRTLLPAMQQIVAQNPGVRLVVVGDGPLEDDLRQRTHELGIAQNVTFTGFRTDIPDVLAAADVFVLPSGIEGLPLAMLEAMAAGKAVVAAISGGTPEVVSHGQTGLLVEQGNVPELVDALALLVNDRAKRERLAECGRQRVNEHFTVDTMVTRHDALYRTLMRRGVPGQDAVAAATR